MKILLWGKRIQDLNWIEIGIFQGEAFCVGCDVMQYEIDNKDNYVSFYSQVLDENS